MSKYSDFDNSAIRAGLGASRRMKRYQKYTYNDFTKTKGLYVAAAGGGVGAVSDTNVNQLHMPNGGYYEVRLEQDFAGAAPQLKFHESAANNRGMELFVDDADGEGIAFTPGDAAPVAAAGAKNVFTVGTDLDFFARVVFRLDDVSDVDTCGLGWVQATQGLIDTALFTAYDDVFAINVDAGDIKTIVDLNNAGPTTTDTTDNMADNDTIAIEIRVSKGGWARAYVKVDTASALAPELPILTANDVPTTDSVAHQFDSGDEIMPVFQMVSTAATPEISILEWESGYMLDRGLSSIADFGEEPYDDGTK